MRRLQLIFFTLLFTLCSFLSIAQPPLIDHAVVKALDGEMSGESAKRNLEYITRLHRMRGSAEFKKAVDFIESRLKEYGLEDVEVFQIPADGKSMYGTQKSRLVWEAEFAELWELEKDGAGWKPKFRIADWESMPITLAEDSESGEATAELVDIGAGTSEKDYDNKDVKGKIVLTSASPSSVVALAVGKGAVGIVSYTQNQLTAWWKEDQNLIRWGHFESFAPVKSFCFMISLKQAREFQTRLGRGEKIMLHGKVKAGQHAGSYSFVTAVIRGTDPALKEEEIAFTCHLDHQRPGANDNASGSMTILEIARAMNKLISEGRLQRPQRTMRFIWSPEIEGTSAILSQRPAYAKKIKAVVHMDMVGGGQVTKSIFHVAGAPRSLPNFVADVGQVFGAYVNEQTDAYASGYQYDYKFVSNEGGKEAQQAVLGQFHMGSDHDVYNEGSFRIPCIYMHDWPDRYIHTNFDLPANIDPTKLKRAAFIGGASGYFLANITQSNVPTIWNIVRQQSLRRTADMIQRLNQVPKEEADNLIANHFIYERGVFSSLKSFAPIPAALGKEADVFYANLEQTTGKSKAMETKSRTPSVVYKRNPAVKGPLSVFGYDYLSDHYGQKADSIRLLRYQGVWGHEYAYETLNFVDGTRTVVDIRNAVSAEFGPIPLDLVEEYLKALESIQVIMR
jgi:aminopeptidase YwaD